MACFCKARELRMGFYIFVKKRREKEDTKKEEHSAQMVWPAKLKILSDHLQKKFADACSRLT